MNEPYECIPRRILQDYRLSLEARGMLAYLLSMPKNWQIHAKQVESANQITSYHRRLVFQELERLGYMYRAQPRNSQHHCLGSQWYLAKVPMLQISDYRQFRSSEKPIFGKSQHIENTDIERIHIPKENTQREESTHEPACPICLALDEPFPQFCDDLSHGDPAQWKH